MQTYEKIFHLIVIMGEQEWGHELMEQSANEVFAKYPSRRPIIATVYEHGGWFLQYAREGDETIIVGTANDTAILSESAKAFMQGIANATPIELPPVRRD